MKGRARVQKEDLPEDVGEWHLVESDSWVRVCVLLFFWAEPGRMKS